jgi:hypothetical protein
MYLGGVGSVVGNPFDVLKTLAQTNKDKAVPLTTLVSQMYQNQGIAGFYRGVEANVVRACVLNATKMGVYDLTKGKFCTTGLVPDFFVANHLLTDPFLDAISVSKGYVTEYSKF